jgi:hypothetical protein
MQKEEDFQHRLNNLGKIIRRIGNGTIEVKVQDSKPIRAYKITENIDLNNDDEVEKAK